MTQLPIYANQTESGALEDRNSRKNTVGPRRPSHAPAADPARLEWLAYLPRVTPVCSASILFTPPGAQRSPITPLVHLVASEISRARRS